MIITSIPDSYRSKFPNIPTQLFSYFDQLLKKSSKKSQFHTAMMNHPEETFENLDFKFKSAAEILSLSPDDLLKKFDFNLNDLRTDRIESLLGELRTIHFLTENGFTEIEPIRASSSKMPDFSARIENLPFLIEVFTFIHSSSKDFHDTIINKMKHRIENEKILQTQSTSFEYYKLFVCVLNTKKALALNTYRDYLHIAKCVWENLESNKNLHIAIVTGQISLNGVKDDCIYPMINDNVI